MTIRSSLKPTHSSIMRLWPVTHLHELEASSVPAVPCDLLGRASKRVGQVRVRTALHLHQPYITDPGPRLIRTKLITVHKQCARGRCSKLHIMQMDILTDPLTIRTLPPTPTRSTRATSVCPYRHAIWRAVLCPHANRDKRSEQVD